MSAKAYTNDPQLNEFIRGYITAMLWAETDEDEIPLDDNYDIDDISPETLSKIVEDCTVFYNANREDLRIGPDHFRGGEGTIYDWHGHDFWLTSKGHGTGFWDRKYSDDPDKGKRLSEACKGYGDHYPYVGDDGLIYL